MSKVLAHTLIGLAIAGMIGLIYAGAFGTPPGWGVLLLFVVWMAAFGSNIAKATRASIREWTARRIIATHPAGPNPALRLMCGYPPYVLETAYEFGESKDPENVPVLMLAIERLIQDQPAGWREMSGAMAEALAKIRDPRCLPLLKQLRSVPGAEEIESLPEAIAFLENAAVLLRASGATSRPDELLRPSPLSAGTDPANLLRPNQPDDT